jgi:soluble lytic murein transglycosylase
MGLFQHSLKGLAVAAAAWLFLGTGSPGSAAVRIHVDAEGVEHFVIVPAKTPAPPVPPAPPPAEPPMFEPAALPAPPLGSYADLIAPIAASHGLDPELIRAVIRAESNFDPLALSHKGARGLMQLMPGTAARFAVADPFDPEENIRGGVQYLRFLRDRFDGQLPLILAAYNAGENAVRRHGGIPPYPETRKYVARILEEYGRTAKPPAAPTTAGLAPAPEAFPPVVTAPPSSDQPLPLPTPLPRPALYRSVAPDGTIRISNLPLDSPLPCPTP